MTVAKKQEVHPIEQEGSVEQINIIVYVATTERN